MSDVERTSAGLQMVIPGCERRTLPKSTSRVDGVGQGLLHFYKPPSLRETLEIFARMHPCGRAKDKRHCRGVVCSATNCRSTATPAKAFVWRHGVV